jgi:hypothetical protein
MSIDKKNTDETNAKNAVTDSPDTEVLVEKVREIERAKQEAAKAIDAKIWKRKTPRKFSPKNSISRR